MTIDPQRDRLSTVPLEILLMITTHLLPRLSEPEVVHLRPSSSLTDSWAQPLEEQYRFFSHPHLLALSSTCKHLHALLAPELLKGLLRAEDIDLLGFAIRRTHLPLAIKLLEDKHVEVTEERLLEWMGMQFWDNEQEEVREEVVRVLTRLGAGKALGRGWHSMMGLRWPGR